MLCCSSMANAAFFEGVDSNIVQEEEIDGTRVVLKGSITTPDGLFTYVNALDGILIFSRDPSTGNLTRVGVFSGDSFPAGSDIVDVSAKSLAVSPDSTSLYMSGIFGFHGAGVEGDAPIQRQTTVVKFDIDSTTGLLTFNDHTDMGRLNFDSISDIVLSSDGSRLVVARATGNPGTTDVLLVNTANMQSLFTLIDDEDASVLPAATNLRIALSPDDQTVYLGNPTQNRRMESIPALAVIGIDQTTNRLNVRQTLTEDFFEGLDTSIDISADNALSDITSILPTDDGQFVYTMGDIRTAVELNSGNFGALGVWSVEADGTLSLVRSLSKQEIVFDIVGGDGTFAFDPTLALSPNGDHFLYVSEDQLRDGASRLTVFARDSETGLLSYIDDDQGVGTVDVKATSGGRYFNITQDLPPTITVIDTAVDRTVSFVNNGTTQTQPNGPDGASAIEASLQAFVSNNGPTDDYAVELLIEKPANVELITSEDNCEILANGNIACSALNVVVGDQASFNLVATTADIEVMNTITATARSNKIDIDAANDVDSVVIALSAAPEQEADAPVVDDGVEEADTPVIDDGNVAPVASSGGGGGCSVGGPRTSHDVAFWVLFIASAGLFLRRKKMTVQPSNQPA